jgi:uncharacterized protein YqgC (DUF456 family)
MEVLWWVIIGVLMFLGMFGAIYPIIPDSLLILAGAVLNHFVIPPPHAVGWWTLGVLGALCLLAHLVDFTASALGARKFGGTRWGAVGGAIGGLIGTIFFFPWGLFVGPVIGALCGEVIFAGRALGPAARAGWGTLLGTTAGMLGKIIIDATMIAVFCAALLLGF